MKKSVIVLLALILLLCLCACSSPEDAAPTQPETTAPAKPQIMYDGVLYEVPDLTTGVAFDEDTEYGEVTLIDADKTPEKDMECNLRAGKIQTVDMGNYFILIVDGKQYPIDKQ